MLVKELIEKLDTELDYTEITSDGESEIQPICPFGKLW